jgi:hypothetical protein
VQVFANLLNNAAKYTDAHGHITLAVTVEDGEAVVKVRDDGTGMTPELLARAFDLFVQETRSLDRAQGGLGIGLTMVRTLVQMHGGSVRAFSDGPGRGSEFVVRLPLATPAPARPSPRDPTGQSRPKPPNRRATGCSWPRCFGDDPVPARAGRVRRCRRIVFGSGTRSGFFSIVAGVER